MYSSINKVPEESLEICKRQQPRDGLVFSLQNLTQELLEAQQEPLKEVSLDYESSIDEYSEADWISVESLECDGLPVEEEEAFTNFKNAHNAKPNKDKPVKIQCTVDVKQLFKNAASTPQKHTNIQTLGGSLCAELNNKENRVGENVDGLKEIVVKNVKYRIIKRLGQGGSSIVYYCCERETGHERAIKRVDLGSDVNGVGYVNEVKILERLRNCDRVIKMYEYEYIEDKNVLLVVLEKSGVDLSRVLKDLVRTGKKLPMHILMFFWMEMLYAVKQVHDEGIIHSDLKPGNFLQGELGLKLIDFGISSSMQQDKAFAVKNVQVGSLNYISPEALINDPSNNCQSPTHGKVRYKVSYKSDIWSLGCILYQMAHQKTPFQDFTEILPKLRAITDPNHKICYPAGEWPPAKITNTIKKCLRYDMHKRPSVDELIDEYKNVYL